MFDTVNKVERGRTQYIPYEKKVTIHEHRAPTDDSIKLVNEYQVKAQENIANTFNLKDNVVNGIVVGFGDTIDRNKISWWCKFSLNGQQHSFKGECDRDEWAEQLIAVCISGKDITVPRLLYQKFIEKLSELFFCELMGLKTWVPQIGMIVKQ